MSVIKRYVDSALESAAAVQQAVTGMFGFADANTDDSQTTPSFRIPWPGRRDNWEELIDERIEEAIRRHNLPSKRDMRKLEVKISELTEKINELLRSGSP